MMMEICGQHRNSYGRGIVGGASKVHPVAKTNIAILGVKSASELAGIICAAGLAQNLEHLGSCD